MAKRGRRRDDYDYEEGNRTFWRIIRELPWPTILIALGVGAGGATGVHEIASPTPQEEAKQEAIDTISEPVKVVPACHEEAILQAIDQVNMEVRKGKTSCVQAVEELARRHVWLLPK